MAAEVRINFRIGGAEQVTRMLQSIAQATDKAARASVRSERQAGQEKVRDMNAAARQRIAIEADAQRQIQRMQLATHRNELAMSRDRAREAARATAEEKRQAERTAKERQRILSGAVGGGASGDGKFVRTLGRGVVSGAAGGVRGAASIAVGAGSAVTGAVGLAGIQSAIERRLQLGKINAQLIADTNEKGKDPYKSSDLIAKQQKVAMSTGIEATSVAEAMSVAAGEGGGRKGLEAFTGELDKFAEIALASGTKLEDVAKLSATLTNNMVTSSEEQVKVVTDLLGAAKKNNVNLRDEAEKVMTVAGAHQAGGFAGGGAGRVVQSGALMQIAKLGGAGNREDAATAAKNFYSDIAGHEKNIRKLGVQTVDKKSGKRIDAVEQFIQLAEKSKGDITKIDPQFGTQSASVMGALSAAFRGENTDLKDDSGKTMSGRAAVEKLMKESSTGGMEFADVQKDAAIVMGDTSNKIARAMESFRAQIGDRLVPVVEQNVGNFAKLAESVVSATGYMVENPGKAAAAFLGLAAAMGAFQTALGVLGTGLLEKMFPKTLASMNVTAANVIVGGKPGLPTPTPGTGGAAGGAAGAAGTAAGTAGTAAGTAGTAAGAAGTATKAASGAGRLAAVGRFASRAAVFAGGRLIPGIGGFLGGVDAGSWAFGKMEEQQKGRQSLINESMSLGTKLKSGESTDADRTRAKELVSQLLDTGRNPTMNSRVGGLIGNDRTTENAGPAAEQLKEALVAAQIKLDPSSTVNFAPGTTLNVVVTNAAEMSGNLQRPGVQPPLPLAHLAHAGGHACPCLPSRLVRRRRPVVHPRRHHVRRRLPPGPRSRRRRAAHRARPRPARAAPVQRPAPPHPGRSHHPPGTGAAHRDRAPARRTSRPRPGPRTAPAPPRTVSRWTATTRRRRGGRRL